MKRSEKWGIIIGLIVGILMLILSILVSLWPASTVQGASKTSEQGDHANSWRYEDGKPREDSGKSLRGTARVIDHPMPRHRGLMLVNGRGRLTGNR